MNTLIICLLDTNRLEACNRCHSAELHGLGYRSAVRLDLIYLLTRLFVILLASSAAKCKRFRLM